jgi:integrase
MAYPEKRKGTLTGKWIADFVLRGHRFKPAPFATMSEADGYEAYVRATGTEPPHHVKASGTGKTFREVAEMCKAAGGPRKGKWRASKDTSVIQRLELVCERLGDVDISMVGTLMLDDMVTWLRKRPGYHGSRSLTPATINRYLSAASAVFSFASARGLIVGRPVIPLQTEDGERTEVLSPELEDALLAWLEAHGHASEATVVRVLLETGMRVGELYALAPMQIAIEWIRLTPDQTKTSKGREVYLHPDLARDLRALVASGGLPNMYHLRKHFTDGVKACGGSDELVLHSMRHTRATRLLQSGTLPAIVMQMLGWSSTSTMMRYTHVNSQMHAEAAKITSRVGGDLGKIGTVVSLRDRKKAHKIKAPKKPDGVERFVNPTCNHTPLVISD